MKDKRQKRPKYYSTTRPIGQTLEDIRKMLDLFGADRLTVDQQLREGKVTIRFEWQGNVIKIGVDGKRILECLEEVKGISREQRTLEHAVKVGLRLLLNYLHNCFELIDWRLMDAAEMFMPYLVLPGRREMTLKDALIRDGRIMITAENVKKLALPEGDKAS